MTERSIDGTGGADRELPEAVVEEAERLTRLAREAVDEAERSAYLDRREELAAEHGFTTRVRDDDAADVLVLHPEEWIEGDSVDPERIDDLDRAVEVPLSGAGDPDDWEAVDEHNRELVATVRDAHGEVHGENAAAFADFIGNHYAKPVEDATAAEVREFLDEYFPRNAWPSDRQEAVVGQSLELLFEAADRELPEP